MRWIICSFFLSSLGLLAGDPSNVALKLLRDVQSSTRAGEVPDDLAISNFCGPEKREIINSRWKNRGAWLKSAEYELSPLSEKIDGDLASVLIGARTKVSPEAVAVIALGLVKKGTEWRVAPLEGSFDNTGLGFSLVTRDRVRALEQWMVLEKMSGTARLRDEERERFQKSMEGIVDPEKLKLEDSRDVLVEFLKAAHSGETEKLLVWQGVLERDQLPERDWGRDIQATRKGMSHQDTRSAWQTLRSNKVMKVIVEGHEDTEEASYLVAFLATFKTDPRNDLLNPIRFQFLMTERGWRVKLPAFYAYDEDAQEIHREAADQEFDWADRRTANEMGTVFENKNDPIRMVGPKALLDGVSADLNVGDLHSFLRRHFRKVEKFIDDEEKEEALANQNRAKEDIDDRRMARYREAMKWWGSALGKEEIRKVDIQKVYHEGDLALGVLALGSDESGWKPSYQEIWMAKEEEGWMILPGLPDPLSHSISPSLVKTRENISKSYTRDLPQLKEEYFLAILKRFEMDDPTGSAINEAGALRLVKEWHEVAAQGTMLELVAKSAARFIPEEPGEFIRNLGYLRSAAGASQVPNRVLGSQVSGRFWGVSLMVDVGPGIDPSFPLAIVVPTKNAYRVLTDIELPLETNKGLTLLNDARIESLETELGEKDFIAIKKLREWHQNLAKPVWEQWNLDQALKVK